MCNDRSKSLAIEQKHNNKNVCLELLCKVDDDPDLFSHVITSDKSEEWHISLTKKSRIKDQVNADLLFLAVDVYLTEHVPPTQISTQIFTKKFLKDSEKRRHLDVLP